MPMYTAHHARYYAHELTRQHAAGGVDRLSRSLFDAQVDLNPHQIEAALFALKSPLQEGVLLADEVGLGKTIEAALVLCQYWAERRRRLLIICPASLRKQWEQELHDKFAVPAMVLDASTLGKAMPGKGDEVSLRTLTGQQVLIMSYQFAVRQESALRSIAWDLVVIDEAHKLRNAHRGSNRTGQAIRRALAGRHKLLLTATPLQNSLMELYGLGSVLDEHLFGDEAVFRQQFVNQGGNLAELRARLAPVVKRTLRKDVLEYVRYTERKALTQPFEPTDDEQALYEQISTFLQREHSYTLPRQQRHLTSLVLRKLLASSTAAILATLGTVRQRLCRLRDDMDSSALESDPVFLKGLAEDDVLPPDLLEGQDDRDDAETPTGAGDAGSADSVPAVDRMVSGSGSMDVAKNGAKDVQSTGQPPERAELQAEIDELDRFIQTAEGLTTDTKAQALLKALGLGFDRMAALGAPRKAIIFTESRRTQEYLHRFLSANGHAGKLVLFSGSNTNEDATAIYQAWLQQNQGSDRVTGSPQIDRRTALIDRFRLSDEAEIMIATEAAAEGVNLQFCSLLLNYDLPWNPQRVEQRIGRCHRYGQRFDVVVINFLNTRNQADQRVLELLTDKFHLFSGVFGASDEVLGQVAESGLDFEKRILQIYESCRRPEDIQAAFDALQAELEAVISQRIHDTQRQLLEHFDEDVHDRLKLRLQEAETRLDRIGRWFWGLSRYALRDRAAFDEAAHRFTLQVPPTGTQAGTYQLLRCASQPCPHAHAYRLSHPLGEWSIAQGLAAETPAVEIRFDYAHHGARLSVVKPLQGRRGWLMLTRLAITAFDTREFLLFSALRDDGVWLDQETCEKLFTLQAATTPIPVAEQPPADMLAHAQRRVEVTVASVLDENTRLFEAERDKLERWADDRPEAAEEALKTSKARISQLKRDARKAQTPEEQLRIQRALAEAERAKHRLRKTLFDVEDEIMARRDRLIAGLQQRLQQHTALEQLFCVRWVVT